MRNLWIYGCSFSYPFWDGEIKDAGVPKITTAEGWPSILSKKLNYKYQNRAQPGYGWNHISYNLEKDIVEGRIRKDDIIVISPSFFSRVTFPEVDEEKIPNQDLTEFAARYCYDHSTFVQMNIKRFTYKLLTLKELGYNVAGWIWANPVDVGDSFHDPYLLKVKESLIPAPDGNLIWEDWIIKNPECMVIPGELRPDFGWDGDTHFSSYGHKIAAEQIYSSVSKFSKVQII